MPHVPEPADGCGRQRWLPPRTARRPRDAACRTRSRTGSALRTLGHARGDRPARMRGAVRPRRGGGDCRRALRRQAHAAGASAMTASRRDQDAPPDPSPPPGLVRVDDHARGDGRLHVRARRRGDGGRRAARRVPAAERTRAPARARLPGRDVRAVGRRPAGEPRRQLALLQSDRDQHQRALQGRLRAHQAAGAAHAASRGGRGLRRHRDRQGGALLRRRVRRRGR